MKFISIGKFVKIWFCKKQRCRYSNHVEFNLEHKYVIYFKVNKLLRAQLLERQRLLWTSFKAHIRFANYGLDTCMFEMYDVAGRLAGL